MPSTFTDSLRLEEQGIGENNNTWGDKLNSTIDLIDKSIAGHVSVATTGGTTQLTTVNNGEDQARYRIIELTGTLGSNAVIEVPAVSKEYIVWDSTTRGGFTVSFRIGAAGSTILIPASTTRAFGINTDGTDWRPLSADLASETAPGIVEIATTAEAQAGTSNSVVLTPARLQDVSATATRSGVVELATDAEAQTGTDTARAITPANLQAVTATETRKGVIELATQTEVNAGTDTVRGVVPATLKEYVDQRTATETTTGAIELATQTEVDTGTDTARAVVPATLQSRLDSYTASRVGTTTGDLAGVTYAEVTVSGGGFNSFTLKCMKVGKLVSLWTENFVSHSSGSSITSTSASIPTAFRPANTYTQNQQFGTQTEVQSVFSSGNLRMEYRGADGFPVNRTGSAWPFNVTYGTSA